MLPWGMWGAPCRGYSLCLAKGAGTQDSWVLFLALRCLLPSHLGSLPPPQSALRKSRAGSLGSIPLCEVGGGPGLLGSIPLCKQREDRRPQMSRSHLTPGIGVGPAAEGPRCLGPHTVPRVTLLPFITPYPRLESGREELRGHCEGLQRELGALRQRSQELGDLAKEAQALRDEMDMLR